MHLNRVCLTAFDVQLCVPTNEHEAREDPDRASQFWVELSQSNAAPLLTGTQCLALHTIYIILHCLSNEERLPTHLWHDFQRLLYVIAAVSMLLPAGVPADEQLLLPLRSWIRDNYPVSYVSLSSAYAKLITNSCIECA